MARTLLYIPRARGLRWLVDLVVVVATIACILHFSRRHSVDCRWERLRASCDVAWEDSLGRLTHETVPGIRGAAYRSEGAVGLVTDARNKGEHALFGTHEILLETADAAARLEAFAADREPERFAADVGVARPRLVTAVLLAALLAYALATRSRVMRVAVDARSKAVTVRGGESPGAAATIEGIAAVGVEEGGKRRGGQRVCLYLRSGKARPLTEAYSKGGQHEAFAEQLAAALGVPVREPC